MNHLQLIYMYFTIVSMISIGIPIILRLSYFRQDGWMNVWRGLLWLEHITALANTLLHELSHCLFAILTGGRAHTITLHHDTSGLAITGTRNTRWARALVSYAGYTGSSLSAIGLFYLLYREQYTVIIYAFLCLAIISAVFWIRNLYGFVWSISFIALLLYIVYQQMGALIIHTSIFFSVVVLVQSITTAFTIFKLSLTNRKEAGDATNLANATFVPAFIWGTLFFGQALYAGYYVYQTFML